MNLFLISYLTSFILFVSNPLTIYNQNISQLDDAMMTPYEETQIINELNESIISHHNNLNDLKITCIGDSITYGNGGSLNLDGTRFNYCNYLETLTNRKVINLGIGGSPIGDYWDESSLILRWQEIPKDTDIIIIFAGINDYFIGEFDNNNEHNFKKDSYLLLKKIKDTYINSSIYVVLTYKNETIYWENFKNNNFCKYMDLLKQYCVELNINIIDLTHTNFLNSNDNNIKFNYIPDGIHPNDNGSIVLGKMLATQIILNNLK